MGVPSLFTPIIPYTSPHTPYLKHPKLGPKPSGQIPPFLQSNMPQRKVLTEYKDQIQKTLDDMVTLHCPSHPAYWVGIFLNIPHKPNGTLHIYLDPKDLNKATAWKYCKVPTLDEISQQLSGATCVAVFYYISIHFEYLYTKFIHGILLWTYFGRY